MVFVEAGDDDPHLEFAEVERSGGRLGADKDLKSLGGELARAEVLHHILTDASSEGGEQKLSRGHALVRGSVFGWLIEHNPVMAGLGGKRCAAGVLQRDLQNLLPVQAFPWLHIGLSTSLAILWSRWNTGDSGRTMRLSAEFSVTVLC